MYKPDKIMMLIFVANDKDIKMCFLLYIRVYNVLQYIN